MDHNEQRAAADGQLIGLVVGVGLLVEIGRLGGQCAEPMNHTLGEDHGRRILYCSCHNEALVLAGWPGSRWAGEPYEGEPKAQDNAAGASTHKLVSHATQAPGRGASQFPGASGSSLK